MVEYQECLAILDSDPANPQALAALEQLGAKELASPDAAQALDDARKLLRERGELETVARLFDVEIRAAQSDARRADLLLAKGLLYAEDLLNEESAVECFHRVLELRPDDENAQEVLAHIGLVRENWQKIVTKYLDEARASTDRQLTTSLYVSAAETYARYRPDADEVELYLREALDVEPRNRRAASHLERLLRKRESWAELRDLLAQRVDAAATKEERVHALLAIADLARTHLEDPELAVDCMKKVVAQDPGHPRALSLLVDLYQAQENWSGLVMLYTGALKARRRSIVREPETGMLLQIAMLHWKHLDNPDAAEEYFRRVRKTEPGHPAALEFYREYYAQRNEAPRLLQVMRQALKSPRVADDAARKKDLSIEIAELAETQLGNPEKAIEAWKAILRTEPDNQDARAALARLYRRTEKWNALLDLVRDEVERLAAIDGAARIERLLEVVEIYRDRLRLDVMVINAYNSILEIDPGYVPALEALAQKYQELGRYSDLIGVLTRRVNLPDAPVAVQIELLREIAALWCDRFGNYAQAIRPLEALLTVAPEDAGAIASLKEIYARRRQWRALIDLMAREVPLLPADRRRDHVIDMARLASDRLGEPRAAIALWNQIQELHAEAADPDAVTALIGLYERQKRWLAVAEMVHRQRTDDPAQAIAAFEKLASLYADKLDAPTQAAAALRAVLALDRGHARALRTLRDLFADRGDYAALEDLYGGLGQWEDLVDIFAALADRPGERAAQIALLERTARIAVDKVQSDERAVRAYERILALDAEHLGAARALAPIYERNEKWARLLAVYEVILAHTESPTLKLKLHLDIRDLCERRLGAKAQAFAWAVRAYELDPAAPDLLEQLERLGAEADAWDEVCTVLEQRTGADDVDDEEKVRLLSELGRIAATRLKDPERARRHYEALLALAPGDATALDALERIATEAQRWADLVAIYRRRAGRAGAVERRIELLLKVAFLQEERLGDLDAAAQTYRVILDLDGTLLRAVKALAKLQEERGDAAGLAAALEHELSLATEADHQVALHLRLGGLYEDLLDRPADALAAYRVALALAPSKPSVHAALERFLIPPGATADMAEAAVEVAGLLLPVYMEIDDPARTARAIEILRAAAPPAACLEHDRRLVRLYGARLADPARAYEAAVRVLAEDPGDAANRRALLDFAGDVDRLADLAGRLQQALDALPEAKLDARPDAKPDARPDDRLRRDLAIEIAQLYDERLQRPEAAEAAWRRVLAIQPTSASAYEALDRIYRGQERWQDLRALLIGREENTGDAAARKAILLSICDLDEGVLDDIDAAIASYQRVLALDPKLARAYKALERLYAETGAWAELEQTLAREVAQLASPDGRDMARIELMVRRALIRARNLDAAEGAVNLLEEIVRARPGHTDARELLEELLAHPGQRLRVARLLEPLYAADGLWRDLCIVLRAQVELAETPRVRADLLGRVAVIEQDRLASERAAFDTWVSALAADPDSPAPREALLRMAPAVDRVADAALAWEVATEAVGRDRPDLLAALLAELADLYDRGLRDSASAVSAYRRLLDVSAGRPELAERAAVALDRLYAEAQAWPELVAIVRRRASLAESIADRKDLLVRVAHVQEDKLADIDAAVATWREVLAEDPEETRALDALERIFTLRERPRDLVEVLRRRVELAADGHERRLLLRRIAELCERSLGAPAEAIFAHLEVLEHVPDDRQTLGDLARLYRDAGRWADLLDIGERRLALATDRLERVELAYDQGVVLVKRLDRRAEALERFADVLRENPHHVGALAAVESLVDDEELRGGAAAILLPIYEAAADHPKLASLLSRRAEMLADPRERARCLRRVARIRERELDDSASAFEVYAGYVHEVVGDAELAEDVAELERLAVRLGRESDLIAVYRAIAPDVLDAELQRRLYLDIADLARAVLHDLDVAREYYQRVLDGQPDDTRAMLALEDIYRQGGEHERLYQILARKAELADDDPDERVAALAEAATLCAGTLRRPEDAIAHWDAVLEIAPDDREAARALEALYQSMGRFSELAELLERRLGFAFNVDEAVGLRVRLGEIYETRLHDPVQAVESYGAALGGDANHPVATAALERFLDDPDTRAHAAEVLEPVYVARHDWPRLVRIYEIKLAAADDAATRSELTRDIARLYEDQLEDLDEAFRWYGRVFREVPGDESVRDQLARLAAVLQSWAGLARVYQDHVDEAGDAAEIAVLRALADLYDQRLGDVDHALACYRRVLALTPRDLGVFARLEAMLTRVGRWHDLVDSYEEAIDGATDDAQRQDLQGRIALVQEDQLGNPERAIEAYQAILALAPDHEEAARALDRLYQGGEQWFELAELLAHRIERAHTGDDGPDAARVGAILDLRVRLAEVLEQRLDDAAGAIDQLEIVLATPVGGNGAAGGVPEAAAGRVPGAVRGLGAAASLRSALPSAPSSLREDLFGPRSEERSPQGEHRTGAQMGWTWAVAMLEQLVVSEAHQERVAALLEPVYRRHDWWQKLVVLIRDAQLPHVSDQARRVAMLREVASLHARRGGDERLAFGALARAWREDVANEEVYAELAAQAARLEAWTELAATLEAGVEGNYDYDLVGVVWARVADLQENRRGDGVRAVAAHRRVLEVKEDDGHALAQLDRLLGTQGRWREQVEVLARRVELAGSEAHRRDLLYRIAALQEEPLGQVPEAIQTWRAVLGLDDTDQRALDALERLYRATRDMTELAMVLVQKIDLADNPAARRALRLAVAEVNDEHLGDPYDAIAQLREILAENLDDDEALARLDRIYAREKMTSELCEVLDRRAALAAGAERTELAYRGARLVEQDLLDGAAAIARYAAVLELDPSHAGTRASLDALTRDEDTLEAAATVLERRYRAEGAFAEVAELYERQLAVASADPGQRTQTFAALADVHEVSRGDLDSAFAVWARALAELPEEPLVKRELERLAASLGAWQKLTDLYAARLEETVDARLEYLYAERVARLYEEAQGDLALAAKYYRRALAVATDERPPLLALARIYEREAKWRELADVLARQAEATLDEEAQAEILYRLGDVRERELAELGGAVAAYQDVLERSPQHMAARAALERLLSSAAERRDIIAILEPIYEADGDWARLADLLGAKLGVTEDALDRALLYQRVAEIAERELGDAVRALDATGGWLAEDPRSERALAELERLAERGRRWGEVAARLAGIIDATDDADVAQALRLRLGHVQLDRIGDVAAAQATFGAVLERDADSEEALVALERIHRAAGDPARLAAVLARRGALVFDAKQKRAAFVEVAGLREALGDSDAAVAAWREVLDLDEGDREAHARLATLYETRAKWRELCDVLELAARFAADHAEEASLRKRLARRYAVQGEIDESVAAWQVVLDLDGRDREALAALEDLHNRREDWLAVQDVLVRLLDGLTTKVERVEVFRRLAKIAEERRHSVDEAVGYLHQILDVDPAALFAYQELERLLAAAERWHELVDVLRRASDVIGTLGDTRREIDMLARVADIWQGPLENPDAAGEILEEILRREPGYVPALSRLAQIYEGAGRWDRCEEILSRALALGPTGRDAADLTFRLGSVAQKEKGDLDAAMRHFGQALHHDPTHPAAVAAIEEVARENQDWATVANMVVRRESVATDPATKRELLLELCTLYGDKLGQPEQVIPLLDRVAHDDPEDLGVIGPLADLYFGAGRHADAQPLYERLAEEAKAKRRMKEVAEYRQRLGRIAEARGQHELALAAYEEAFRVNPTDAVTMAGLGRLYVAHQDWEKARRVYRSLVLQNLDPSLGLSKADVYAQLGHIHVGLGEPAKAKGMYQRGLELDPDNAALARALAAVQE
jgi:tetratricopeptide (TPR) repeat protein